MPRFAFLLSCMFWCRISYCTADKAIGKVFGYVVQNPKTESFEFHAYMCGSRKQVRCLSSCFSSHFIVFNVWIALSLS